MVGHTAGGLRSMGDKDLEESVHGCMMLFGLLIMIALSGIFWVGLFLVIKFTLRY